MTLWFTFVAFSAATWLVYVRWWMFGWYYVALVGLALVNVMLSIWLLRKSHFKARPFAAVLLILIVGQWWAVEFFAVETLWRRSGFAP